MTSGKRMATRRFRTDIINDLREALFKDRVHFDIGFFRDYPELTPDGTDEQGPWIKGTTYVAWDLRRRAARIESMTFRTFEEWAALGDAKWTCPKCKESLNSD